ncbi:acetyl-CoA carboxylase biotin carboxylase subunit, partial [Staphylococcus aureus]|nr:acetyl-CoA carboxylase biotin carboxylase subunit [Staphylococcus aureus]
KFRHIEIQIVGDSYGNVINLGERDFTIKRRMQKLVEEAHSPILDDETRREMGNSALRAAKAENYENAGTIEFIYD